MRPTFLAALTLVPAFVCTAETAPTTPLAAPPNLDPLVAEAVVRAPVAEIWRVFSTPEGYAKLGVAKADMDFRPGGLIRSTYDPAVALDGEGAIQTEILAYEPARMIATRIHRPPKGFPFMAAYRSVWTVVSMADLGDGRTDVRVTMLGYGADAESQAMREFFRTGNAWVLKKLQASYSSVPPPAGEAHADEPLAPVDVQAVVAADRDRVWRAFTTGEGWRDFLGAQATIGTRPGEKFEVFFDPSAPEGRRGSEGCTVLSIVPGELISYTWNAPPKFPFARGEHTWVVVTLESPSPAVTRVRLRELGFRELAERHPEHRAEFEQVRAYFAAAWPRVLSALAAHFAPPAPTTAPPPRS